MFKQFFDVGSKTFKGAMLALVWLALSVIGMADPAGLPKWTLDIVKVLSLGLILFGWSDVALAEFESFKAKFQKWITTSPGLGFLLQALNLFIDNIPKFPLSHDLVTFFTGLSYFLIVMGVRKMLAGTTMRTLAIPDELKAKYQALSQANIYTQTTVS